MNKERKKSASINIQGNKEEDADWLNGAKFQSLFLNNPLPVIIYNHLTWEISGVNSAAINLYGYSKQEFLSLDITDIYHWEDIPGITKLLNDSDSQFHKTGVIRNRKKNGAIIWVELGIQNIAPKDDSFIFVVIYDVSSQRSMETDLYERDVKYRALFESAVNGVICQDANGIITEVNPSAIQILGMNKVQLIGKIFGDTDWEVLRENGNDFLLQDQPSIKSLSTGEQFQSVMGIRNRMSNSMQWLKVKATPLFKQNDNKPFQVMLIFSILSGQLDIDISRVDMKSTAANYTLREVQKDEPEINGNICLTTEERTILDKLGFAVITVSLTGIISSINNEVKKILGYNSKELTGRKPFVSIIKPDELESEIKILSEGGIKIKDSFEVFANYRKKSKELKNDWTFIARDGNEVSVGLSFTMMSVIPDENSGYICVFRDMTARKNSEQAMTLNEERFLSMFHKHSAIMLLIDPYTGKIEYANESARDFYGYPFSKKSRMNISDINILNRDKIISVLHTALTGKKNSFVFNHKLANNELRTVESFSTPVELKGKVLLFSIINDITERIRTEKELLFSEARWQAAVEGSGDGIWDWNLVTNEVFYSHQWKTLLGNEDVEISNGFHEWSDRVHPDDLKSFQDSLDKLLKNETEFYIHEHRMLCCDGSYKWILERGKVIECAEPNVPSRVIGTSKDISVRKQLEISMHKSIENERMLSEMKSRFVSIASHEFRTPLANILITSDTLMTYWKNMEEIQVKDKLTKIINQVHHLSNIVNDVLQLSRIEERKIEFKPVDLDIIELCGQVTDTFNANTANKNKVRLKSPYHSVIMSLDSRLMLQIFNNLISNGIKYSGATPEVMVEIVKKSGELCIIVSDHGIGIPEQDCKNLFLPFFRGSNATYIQGNGLGLSIVKESVEMHGGIITFTSQTGKGTSFVIHFPDNLIKSFE
jgi:PAS domain S-box-containing protein